MNATVFQTRVHINDHFISRWIPERSMEQNISTTEIFYQVTRIGFPTPNRNLSLSAYHKISSMQERVLYATESQIEREYFRLGGESYEEPENLSEQWQINLIKAEYERYLKLVINKTVPDPEKKSEKDDPEKNSKNGKAQESIDMCLYERIVADLEAVLKE